MYLFQSEGNTEIIVNDGSSFTRELFEGANKILSSYYRVETHPLAIICPEDYEEDAFQSEQRTNFHLSEWLLVALEVDEKFEPRRALLMNKYRQEEGFVFDFILEKATALFFRYFSIKETPTSPVLQQKDFLESINLGVEQRVSDDYLDFEDYDEEDDHEENYFDTHPLPKTPFVPNRKTYNIPNFGGALNDEQPSTEDEEELEDLHIEVAKPAFVAGKNRKPQNLNALDRNEEYEKEKARQKRIQEEEEKTDLRIEVEKPAFTASNNKKPANLSAIDRQKKYEKKSQEKAKEKPREKELEPDFNIETRKPVFSPSNNLKPRNLADPSKQTISKDKNGNAKFDYAKPPYEAHEKESDLMGSFEQGKKPEDNPILAMAKKQRVSGVTIDNNYKVEPSFNIRPDVFHGEASLINNPKDKYSFASCSVLYEKLKEIKTLRISANCLFVPEIVDNGHEIFSLAKDFVAEDWQLLALIHNIEEKPLYTLLSNKKDENLAIIVSFRHRDPRIMVISTKGIALNDPAYPFYSYRNLLAIVKGESPL